jgi:thiol-disulfide isomerase/thioredoxin
MKFRHVMTGLLLAGVSSTAPAQESAKALRDGDALPDLQKLYETLLPGIEEGRKAEAADQVASILFGNSANPLPGWYGPGKSQYDWTWLAARSDSDRDDKITQLEFNGPESVFALLERDGDGVLTATDLDWSDDSILGKRDSQLLTRFRTIDVDSDGRITPAEWADTYEKAADGSEGMTPDQFRAIVLPQGARVGFGDMPSKLRLDRLKGILRGDVGSFNEGPALGERAPDFRLKTHDGAKTISLSDLRGKPVVLTFGSYTCGPYRSLVSGLNELHAKYGDRVEFLAVYVREAHPIDGWITSYNESAKIEITQPTTLEARLAVANQLCERVDLAFPLLIDQMDDQVGHAYSGMPNRLYLIDPEGEVVYKSGRGPRGYKSGELAQSIELFLLGNGPSSTSAAANDTAPVSTGGR